MRSETVEIYPKNVRFVLRIYITACGTHSRHAVHMSRYAECPVKPCQPCVSISGLILFTIVTCKGLILLYWMVMLWPYYMKYISWEGASMCMKSNPFEIEWFDVSNKGWLRIPWLARSLQLYILMIATKHNQTRFRFRVLVSASDPSLQITLTEISTVKQLWNQPWNPDCKSASRSILNTHVWC